jgi:ABC-type uncharacterized transport system ATPase subunit
LKSLKRQFSKGLIHLSIAASEKEVSALPGVASCQAVNGVFIVKLAPDVDRRQFLRQTLDRYDVAAFSDREPELEEIYLSAVKAVGLEETRIIE